MATAREECNSYGGLGAGGKFRKKPYRMPQSTPYHRPPTAIRNPAIVPCADGNSWLRKLMDPAHMLLATTARRFYNSVFRKRLTQPPPSSSTPPQPPASEAKQEAGDEHAAAISFNISKEQEVASNGNKKATLTLVPGGGSLIDLEEILKQKTFTRSEIDHLTALLHARVVDNPAKVEDKTTDVLLSRSGLFPQRKEETTNIPLQDNGSGSHVISYKAINLSVLDEDVASPADLAKAYMGIRPSKVLPLPILSLAPISSGHVGVRENGYATPRSQGRPALYSVARTPYSRVHVTSTLKSSGLMTDGYDGPSSTTQASECNRISGSSKPLKRSSSILENDIGSGVSMRRIRLKPNLSYQRNWIMSTSEAGEPPSSATKMQSVSRRKLAFTEQSNLATVSSKTSEMGSKILQQLDKIVSPPKQKSSELKLAAAREKASANLSPSKLQGKALKSLEHIDSSKFLEFMTDDNKPDETAARFMQGSGETSKEKQDKIKQNGPSSISAASGKQSPLPNGLQNAVVGKNDTVSIDRTGDANLTNSLAHAPFCAFKMSAPEETCMVEHKPSAAQASVISEKCQIGVEDKHRVNLLAKETTSQDNGKHAVVQTHADFTSLTVLTASSSSQTDLLAIQSPSEPDKAALLESNAASLLPSSGVEVDSVKDQNMPTIFRFASNNDFTVTSSDKSPQLKFGTPSSGEFTYQKTTPDSTAKSLSSGASGPGGRFSSVARLPESDKGGDKKPFGDGASSLVPDGMTLSSVSATSLATFSFGIKSANSSSSSSVSAAISVDSNTIMSEKPFSIHSFPVTFSGNSSSSEPSSTIIATTSALTTFNPSNLVSQASSCTALAPEEAKPKADIGPGITNSSHSSAANSSLRSSIFRFSATTAPSNASNQKEGSAITNTASGSAPVPESPAAGTGVASFIESVQPSSSSEPSTSVAASTSSSFGLSSAAKLFSPSTSFGSGTVPSSEPSFFSPISSGLSGQTTTTATFSSSSTSKSLSSGFSFGSSSSPGSSFVFGSAPGSTSVSSSAITFGLKGTSSVFGIISTSSTSSLTSVLGSTGTSSASTAAFAFGSIGTSSAATGASVFGSNTAAAISSPFLGSTGSSSSPAFLFTAASANHSPGPTFSFTSAAASPSPSPVFGSSSSPLTFGSPALGSNSNTDQMIAEDSMAGDIVQANHTSTPPAPVFGQLQSISPSTGFMLGLNDAAGANAFQFEAQQNLRMPQSPSRLQASGSLDFNTGGGSFSLGTGGADKSGRKIVKFNRNKHRRK